MKVRVISSVIGLGILGVVVVWIHTPLLNVVVGLISGIGVSELLSATKTAQNRPLALLCLLFAFAVPIQSLWLQRVFLTPMVLIFMMLLFALLLWQHQSLRVETVATAFLFSVMIPFSFNTAVWLRDAFGSILGGYYILMALAASWCGDTSAYFAGRAFGKHKLAPAISPKKTVEGLIGGVLVGTVCLILITVGFHRYFAGIGGLSAGEIDLLRLVPVCAGGTLVGVFGDLSMSMVKRQYGVKDYGNIMPGHGGIMDRFDSVLFNLPYFYVISRFMPLLLPAVRP